MSEWLEMTLGDFITLQRGHDLPESERRNGNVPVVGSFGITGYHDTAIVKGPGVTVGRSGASFGTVFYCPVDYWPHNAALYVTDFHGNDEKFVYFFLKTFDFTAYNSGSAQPSLNRNYIYPIPIRVPPPSEQRAIAHILGSLDEKIELNRQMKATLEATARALFKSWFVDFDPVHYKARGEQPPGMDADTAALFPDSFEDSELGPIPAGWRVISIGDAAHIKHGYAFEGKYFDTEPSNDILLTPGNFAIGGGFKDDKFKYYAGPVPEDYVLQEDDLLVTMTDLSKAGDTLGYPALIPPLKSYRLLHNQRLGKVVINSASWASKLFLYHLMRTENYRQQILGSATGSTVKHTSPSRIASFRFVAPPMQITEQFDNISKSLYSGIKLNNQMIITLAELRDALLPKLISGEVRV